MAKDTRSDEVSDENERETVESALDTDASGKPARAEVPRAQPKDVTKKPSAEEEAQDRKGK